MLVMPTLRSGIRAKESTSTMILIDHHYRVLRDGTYLAVTTKSLKPGTPLTISQSSVSHLRMSRAERRAYFQAIGTSCDCRACTGHPLKEPTVRLNSLLIWQNKPN